MARKISARWSVLMLLGLAGCQSNFVAAPNPVEIDAREYHRMFDATILTLRDEGFAIDRQDHRFGKITTKPLSSPTVFEPWRKSNTTGYQTTESTLNNERRVVTIMLEPEGSTASGSEAAASPLAAKPSTPLGTDVKPSSDAVMPPSPTTYRLRVEVVIERLQVPVRYLNGSTRGNQIVSRLRATPTELAQRGIERNYWEPVQRDVYLESRLITSIVRRSVTLPDSRLPDEGSPDATPTTMPTTVPSAQPEIPSPAATEGLEGR